MAELHAEVADVDMLGAGDESIDFVVSAGTEIAAMFDRREAQVMPFQVRALHR